MLFCRGPAVLSGLFVLWIALLSSCTSGYQKVSSKPVVKVNDHILTTKEFAGQLARRLKDLDAFTAKDPGTVYRAKEEIVKAFVVKSLTLDWARLADVVISEGDLNKEVDKYRSNYPDDLSFRRTLARDNLSFTDWREELRYTMIEREFFKKLQEKIKPIGEDEVRSYYNENKIQYQKRERIYIRQILVDELAKAELIKAELKKSSFADLAKKYSIAPEAKEGGIVGWIEKGTVDFFDSSFSLPIGGTSPIIKSDFGFHIIRVEKKLPAATATLDESRPKIVRILMAKREQAEFVSWLDGQLRSSKILKDNDLINSLSVDTRGAHD